MAGPYALTGAGTQAIVACTSLQATITTHGSRSSTGAGFPTNYYRDALITPGNANGWYRAVPISETPMLIPVSRDVDRFGYNCIQGAHISVIEVQALAPAGNPLRIERNFAQNLSNGTSTSGWNYTVPANRALRIELLYAAIDTTAPPVSYALIQLSGTSLLFAQGIGAGTSPQVVIAQLPNPMTLLPGENSTSSAVVYGTTAKGVWMTLLGVEYDWPLWTP